MSPTLAMLSLGSGAFGVTTSLLLIAFVMTMWVLALIILHPVHAFIFIISAGIEYFIYNSYYFDIWLNLLFFLIIYVLLFAGYELFVRKLIPLPKSKIEHLIKLAELHKAGELDDDEYKKAKSLVLKF